MFFFKLLLWYSGNPEHNRRVRAMSGVSSNDDSTMGSASGNWASLEGDQTQPAEGQENRADDESGGIFSGNAEHAYSTASKSPLIKQPK